MFGSMLLRLALVCERRIFFTEPHYRLERFVVYGEHATTMETAREKATAAFVVTRLPAPWYSTLKPLVDDEPMAPEADSESECWQQDASDK
jgi:hypothetical protein